MYGTHLLSATEELQPIELHKIYEMIRQPEESMLATIARLRAIKDIDEKKYSQLKKELPFFVTGIFSPKYRRTENFAYIEYFVVDIDHLVEKDIDIHELGKRIKEDNRILLYFTSPSGNGMKIIFRLQERCYDPGKFAMFYRAFASQFAQQYHLEQAIDSKTCDATRACFLSYDPNAYFSPHPQTVDMRDFLAEDNVEDAFAKDYAILQATKSQKNAPAKELLQGDPDKDTLQQIKLILKQQKALLVQKTKPVYVPEALNEIIADVKLTIEKSGIEVTDIQDIQYGKKIRSRLGNKTSEINLFFGKRGFSVVQTPKRGCSAELNEVVADLLICYFQIPQQ